MEWTDTELPTETEELIEETARGIAFAICANQALEDDEDDWEATTCRIGATLTPDIAQRLRDAANEALDECQLEGDDKIEFLRQVVEHEASRIDSNDR